MLEEDQAEYAANTSWRRNGIFRNGRAEDYPWICTLCNKPKTFYGLRECTAHCETHAHQNAVWWEYNYKGCEAPDVPQWSTMPAGGPVRDQTRSRRGRSPNSGGTSPRAAQTDSPPQAADPRALPSAASAGARTYTVILNGATLNGVPIEGATLEVTIPCAGELPLDGTSVMDGATITGVIRPAHSSIAHGSLRPPVAQTGPAAATNHGTLSGMPLLSVAPTEPPPLWPSHPIEGAHDGALWRGAASARAGIWQGRGRRMDNGDQDSSEPSDSPRL